MTNKPHELTLRILDQLSMTRHFERVIGLDAGFPAKPDPLALLHILDHTGTAAEETLFIGDSRVDAETCHRAGVDFGWVSYGYDRADSHKHSMVFESAHEWGRIAVDAEEQAKSI